MKTAIVTGSTKGIGLAIAKALLNEGYFVFLNYATDEESAEKLGAELSKKWKNCFSIIKQPLSSPSDVDAFYGKIQKQAEKIDLLVLNAAVTDRTKWGEMTDAQWMHVMNTNLNAPASLIRKFDTNLCMEGGIIFIGAIMGIFAHASSIPYTVSKAGIHALTKALVKEYCERNIRVNAVCPGFVETPWQTDKPADQRKRICDKISLHRFATAEEIAEVVLGVIKSTYINGALIEVDGGYCYK